MRGPIRPHVSTLLLAWALALLVPASAPAQEGGPPADLDAFVEATMRAFEVPGLALAIVKDGEIVVAKGYGVREQGRPEPVDAHTRFGIASNTKVFTATALGILVDEGKLRWDAPVIDYLPWFRLSDPYVTEEITIRDLLVHRSGLGLGAGDLLWWPASTYDRREIARRLRHIPLATSFRSAYAYDNVLYSVAGEVIAEITGQSWEDFVQTRILDRVGMTDSDVRHSGAEGGGNVAHPHARVEGTVRPVAPFTSDNTNPAGGINASATDMAKWMNVLLARGRLADGDSLFSQAVSRQLGNIVTPLTPGNPPPELEPLRARFVGYALGLFVRDYRGQKILNHTGGLPGYVSKVTLLPEAGLGVAVLTNQESGETFEAISYHVVDHYLGAPAYDWLGAWRTLKARGDSASAAREAEAASARDSTAGPSLPLAEYAGTYRDPWYGDVKVELEDGGLVIRFVPTPLLVGDLIHWQYDTFLARWRDRELRADAFVTFQLKPDGGIDRVRMVAASPTVDFSYDFQDLDLEPAPGP
jgi:CubicO group peptidase (beta-lactamase class C family)